jgi:hypothetical protein
MHPTSYTKLKTLHKEVAAKLNAAIKNKKSIMVQNQFEKQLLQIKQKLYSC